MTSSFMTMCLPKESAIEAEKITRQEKNLGHPRIDRTSIATSTTILVIYIGLVMEQWYIGLYSLQSRWYAPWSAHAVHLLTASPFGYMKYRSGARSFGIHIASFCIEVLIQNSEACRWTRLTFPTSPI
jgi:hypothetical protein